ncbi:unnamed protein product [Ranitomeya imitator]|uniref:Uncharacterized protein n=1 Tax=Ranitomeya imitator TaxID=111125 RepID=A0ABN9MIE5_9NEOB|nr:unnamed protein product [Ranitomeya imitator]
MQARSKGSEIRMDRKQWVSKAYQVGIICSSHKHTLQERQSRWTAAYQVGIICSSHKHTLQERQSRWTAAYQGGTSQIDDLTVCTALCQITDLTCSSAGFTVPALSRLCEATSLPAGPGSAAILDPGQEQGGREFLLLFPQEAYG